MDPFSTLPLEISEKILSYLPLNDLLSCSRVNKNWNQVASSDVLWKELCMDKDWPDCGSLDDPVYVSKLFKSEKRLKKNADSINNWKKHYLLKNRLYKNWKLGRHKKFCISLNKTAGPALMSVSNNGGLIGYGLEDGTLKLFDVEDNGKMIISKQCFLKEPFTRIKITNDIVVVLQKRYIQIYKMKNGRKDLELNRVVCLLGIGQESGGDPLVDELKDLGSYLCNYGGDIYIDLTEDHLVMTSLMSDFIHVVDLKSDKFKFTHFDVDCKKEVQEIQALHCNGGIAYLLLTECNYQEPVQLIENDEHKGTPWGIQAYNMNEGETVFKINKVTEFFEMRFTMDSNNYYLLVRLSFGLFYIFDKFSGELLYDDCASVFLNASPANQMLIGVIDEYENFRIFNPKTNETTFCMTLEGSPIAMCTNILITLCEEFDATGKGTANLEFWNLFDNCDISVLYKYTFPINENLHPVFTDQTKIILQYEENKLQVYNYLK